jgi:long-chain acyl-CoA synthetase
MTKKFWIKSYDEGVSDLNPSEWETTYIEAVKPTFEKFSNRIALAFMGVKISYSELDHYSNQFANMLISNGFKKGDVVGINLPNIPEYVIAWLGILKAGCVVTGVSPMLSAEEMEYQLNDSNAKGLVTLDAIFALKLTGFAERLHELKVVVAASVGGFLPRIKWFLGKVFKKIPEGKITPLEGKTVLLFKDIIQKSKYAPSLPNIDITPDDIAYIMYTGGTTGSPKGAMLSHRNVVSDLLIVQSWLKWEQGREGVALSGFPFFHLAGLFFNGLVIYLGGTQVLIPDPRDTDHICKEIKKYKPVVLVNVPPLYSMLVANKQFKQFDHSGLDICVSGAAPFPEEAEEELESIVGSGKLLEVYGMTETSPIITMNPVKGKKKLGSVGLPLINTDIRLVDLDTGKEVAVGEPGEICVKGPQVMVGYYKKPEETQNAFDEQGYFHTGDVAIQDQDGYLWIVDRTKDMINVGGYKVFSKKVEEVLAEHPAISMVAIVGVPNPERPGSEIVKAYVVIRPGYDYGGHESVLKEDISKFAKDKLAPYEVPKIIEFRTELPLTMVGKINKKILRKESKNKVI